MENDFKEELR